MQNFVIRQGFEPHHRRRAAELYLEAFGPKLGMLLGTGARVQAFFEDILDPGYAITAVQQDRLLGIAGYKTAEGGLTKGAYADIARHYGHVGGALRGMMLSLLERDVAPDQLLMDGICVDASARGLGVGTALLDATADEARRRDLSHVRLDVIDSNPRARALYERRGFVAGETTHLGLLRHVFGFKASTTLILKV